MKTLTFMKVSGIAPTVLRLIERACVVMAFVLVFAVPADDSPTWGADLFLTKGEAAVAACGAVCAARIRRAARGGRGALTDKTKRHEH